MQNHKPKTEKNEAVASDHQEKPLVWIIIVNWNGKDDTLACLESLTHLTYAPVHILIVDNGSVDDSVAEIGESYPHVQILRNEHNLGFARANNQGMRRAMSAGADYILLLNNDTEVAPDFLDHLVIASLFRDRVGMVAPKIYYHERPQTIWFAGGRVNFWTGRIFHEKIRQLDHPSFDVAESVDYLTGCALLVSKECIADIGMLDEGYFMYSEDVDWSMRAQAAGYTCLYQPESKVWHKVSASSGTSFKLYHKIRSNYQFFRKYARWYHWLTIPICVLSGALFEIVRQLGRSPSGALQQTAAMSAGFRDTLLRRPPQSSAPALKQQRQIEGK